MQQQRQLRLGDILDDYCPRERRVTNHVIVAMVGPDVKHTRCSTCDADHEYKHAKVPRQRRKSETPAVLSSNGAAATPKRVAHDVPVVHEDDVVRPWRRVARRRPRAPPPRLGPSLSNITRRTPIRQPCRWKPTRVEDGPVHRPLIRATLPRHEGQPPPARPAPDFTIRQPAGRPGRFRPRQQRTGQSFGNGPNGNGPNGNVSGRQGGSGGSGGSMRNGGMPRQGGGRPPQGGRQRLASAGATGRVVSRASAPRSFCLTPICPISPENSVSSSASPNKRSISWAIAQAASAAGARLALTYPGRAPRRERARTRRDTRQSARAAMRSVERSADRGSRCGARARVRRPRFFRARCGVRAARRIWTIRSSRRRGKDFASLWTSARTRSSR